MERSWADRETKENREKSQVVQSFTCRQSCMLLLASNGAVYRISKTLLENVCFIGVDVLILFPTSFWNKSYYLLNCC